jgi:hypothetical protein
MCVFRGGNLEVALGVGSVIEALKNKTDVGLGMSTDIPLP